MEKNWGDTPSATLSKPNTVVFYYTPANKVWGYIVILMSVRSFVRSSVPISNPLLLSDR